MKAKILKISLIICSWLLVSSAVQAGFDLTRMTTVVDDLSGSYTVSKNGRLDDMQFTGTSQNSINFILAMKTQRLILMGLFPKSSVAEMAVFRPNLMGPFKWFQPLTSGTFHSQACMSMPMTKGWNWPEKSRSMTKPSMPPNCPKVWPSCCAGYFG